MENNNLELLPWPAYSPDMNKASVKNIDHYEFFSETT
jgi:hypothetical protein